MSDTLNLSGAECAGALREETRGLVGGRVVRLVVVVATDDEGTAWYVRSLGRAAAKVGIECETVQLDPEVAAIREKLAEASASDEVHGIILQTPLPPGARANELGRLIAPHKDVDGANPESLGTLVAGLRDRDRPAFVPATAEAVVRLLDAHGVALAGRRVAVVGRSTVVGKPLAHLLLDRDATVTVCHSKTPDLAAVTRGANIVVAAAGRAGLVTADHLAPGAVVVDVGTNPTPDGGLVGDVDAESVRGVAGALSPVPGGVGPVTTALLLRNTARAAQFAYGTPGPADQ
jgi:methylenetetrahydrofolate dehydrogenase (NADP+) / methenyltetrahydrofolate cyclohydrolase